MIPMGWRMRKDISGDIPFWCGLLIGFGAVLATGVRLGYDLFAHHHSMKRPARG